MRLAAATLATLLLTLPAGAGESPPVDLDADALEACLQTAWPRDVLELCTGIVADPCQTEPGGATTEGMSAFLAREAAAWEALLARMLPRVMQRAREVDAANETEGLGIDSAAETLITAQRTWEVFRDAECRHSHASWGQGAFRAVAHSACRLDLTARRVVDLQARLINGG